VLRTALELGPESLAERAMFAVVGIAVSIPLAGAAYTFFERPIEAGSRNRNSFDSFPELAPDVLLRRNFGQQRPLGHLCHLACRGGKVGGLPLDQCDGIVQGLGKRDGLDVFREARSVDDGLWNERIRSPHGYQTEGSVDVLDFNDGIDLEAFEPGALEELPAGRIPPARKGVVEHQL
jgi:hypothetical protein